ncbi:telomeric repeat-binding factor 2-interacting protein 1 [Megalops cyprinoides]|uniref:telomeric repeat-binding factor 2-interacting protein 1 n=1 Tax=Megalops cyprinoides TaxID=118141 RepID=UPI001864ABDE|nr:telomeric repeat-binding factor 2-interacting protein 1 [Megalops cyprinoides]
MASAVNGRSSPVSQVLFLSETGKPMHFYLRPGPAKAQLQPLIKAGGGVVTSVQMPKAILLADPEDLAAVPASTAHWYVSTQYIRDCVEKNQQLEVEDYRFSTDIPRVQTRASKRKLNGSGRLGYTAEEDAAILRFVSKRKHEVRGNRVWQQMEKQHVTSHSWQSMKDRYRKHLIHQPPAEDSRTEKSEEAKERSLNKDSPQPSPVKDTAQPLPEERLPQASPEERCAESPPERMHPQLLPEEIQPQPSPERTRPQGPPDRTQEQPSPEKTQPQEQTCLQVASETTSALPVVENVKPQTSSEMVQVLSLAREGNPLGEESAGTSNMPTVSNEEMVGTEHIEEEEDVLTSTPKRRKLGILERAMKEFEESEETDDDTPDIVIGSTASADPKALGNGTPVITSEQVIQPNNSGKEAHSEAQSESPNVQSGAPVDSIRTEDTGAEQRSVPSTSNVHMVLLDRELQEEDLSQATDPPFSQAQLEEAKQQLCDLMRKSKQGLVSVTKSLLRNSGDVPASLHYLLTGQNLEARRPLWDQRDDSLLLSADPSEHKLHEKYGEVAVAKRIAFLDIE